MAAIRPSQKKIWCGKPSSVASEIQFVYVGKIWNISPALCVDGFYYLWLWFIQINNNGMQMDMFTHGQGHPRVLFSISFYILIFFFFAVDLFRILTAAKHSRTVCLHEYWYGIKWITAYVGVGEAQFNWTVPIWSISLSLSSGGEFVSMEYNIAFVNVQALSNVSALPMRRIIYILCVCVRAHSPLRER